MPQRARPLHLRVRDGLRAALLGMAVSGRLLPGIAALPVGVLAPRDALLPAALLAAALLGLAVGRRQGRRGAATAAAPAEQHPDLLELAQREARLHQAAATAAQLELGDAMVRMIAVLDTVADGVYVCNQQGRLTLVNPAGWRLLGLPDDGSQLRPVVELVPLLHLRHPEGEALTPGDLPLMRALRGEAVADFELIVDNALLGGDRCLRVSAAPLRNGEGAIVGAVAVAADISDLKETMLALTAQTRTLRRLNQQLEQAASRDSLTGLFNHGRFMEELTAAVRRAHRYDHDLALLMVDVDHFKRINDTYGHGAGDAVLRVVAARLAQGARDADAVGRLGGDEFGLMLPETDMAGALILAERIRASMCRPVVLPSGTSVPLTVSIGVAGACGRAVGSAAQLLHQADEALYAVKRAGRDGIRDGSRAEHVA